MTNFLNIPFCLYEFHLHLTTREGKHMINIPVQAFGS